MDDSYQLQHTQKLWQCQVLQAGERLCSLQKQSSCELTPHHKHWTLVGLVLKCPNSADSSGFFVQMRLNLTPQCPRYIWWIRDHTSCLPGFYISAQRNLWLVSLTGISKSAEEETAEMKKWTLFSLQSWYEDRLVWSFVANSIQEKEKVDTLWAECPWNVNH